MKMKFSCSMSQKWIIFMDFIEFILDYACFMMNFMDMLLLVTCIMLCIVLLQNAENVKL